MSKWPASNAITVRCSLGTSYTYLGAGLWLNNNTSQIFTDNWQPIGRIGPRIVLKVQVGRYLNTDEM